MSKTIAARIVTVIIILTGIAVFWLRYRMSPLMFFSLSAVCIAGSAIKMITVIRNKGSRVLFKSLSVALLCGIMIGVSFIIKGQALNYMIQSKTDAFFNKLPVKVIWSEEMSPKDFEFLQQNRPTSDPDLSNVGNTVVYENKPLNPGNGAVTYSFLFVRPYYIDSLDISMRTCTQALLCQSHFNGSVILDAKTKELLHFSIRNAGGGK